MPLIDSCPWYPHSLIIPPHTFPGSPCYVHLITHWNQWSPPSTSTFFPSLQSDALSFQETPLPSYLLSIHPQLLRPFLGLPTQVRIYSNPFSQNLGIAYFNVIHQLHNALHKFVVKINLHVIWTWKVAHGGFGSHWDEGVAKCRVVSEHKWL